MNGFSCIGLANPKTPSNIGSALRAAGCYGISAVYYTGQRFRKGAKLITDTQKAYRTIPLTNVDDLHDVIPFDCVPVAVELLPGARRLSDYIHPKRAFYIFGPEDGTLGVKITDWCRDVVYVPTNGCMNLAATVNVVLYDRQSKGEWNEPI